MYYLIGKRTKFVYKIYNTQKEAVDWLKTMYQEMHFEVDGASNADFNGFTGNYPMPEPFIIKYYNI